MGRWLTRLKNQESSENDATKTTKRVFVGFVASNSDKKNDFVVSVASISSDLEKTQAHITSRSVGHQDALHLAEKLKIRDQNGDDRRLCLECAHLQGNNRNWLCDNWKHADVAQRLASDLVVMLQRCPGFSVVTSLQEHQDV